LVKVKRRKAWRKRGKRGTKRFCGRKEKLAVNGRKKRHALTCRFLSGCAILQPGGTVGLIVSYLTTTGAKPGSKDVST
jgi:hypothetical protein